ncbi:MAG: hypothetical protein AAGD10_02185 [Myxococcota bacterium]
MADWIASGRAIDAILVLLVLEAMVLPWLLPGVRRSAALANLAAGAFLMLALRSALAGWDWRLSALFLALSLPAHLFDLRIRAESH